MVGTSIIKALEKNKFQNDANVILNVRKAYCIKEEGRVKESNFAAIVPEIVQEGNTDILAV